MPHEDVIQNVISQVQEMFPEHSRRQIEEIVRRTNANIDEAISVVLETPPQPEENPSSSSQNFYSSPPPQNNYNQPPPQNLYNIPPQNNYNQPPAQNLFNIPPQNNYNQPPAQNLYNNPPQNNYNQPPTQNLYNNPPQNNYNQPPTQQVPSFNKPKPKKTNAQHIFPQDFLRWPEDAQVIKEYLPGSAHYNETMNNVGNYAFQMNFPACDPNDDPMPEAQNTQKKSKWDMFKAKISGKNKNQFQQL